MPKFRERDLSNILVTCVNGHKIAIFAGTNEDLMFLNLNKFDFIFKTPRPDFTRNLRDVKCMECDANFVARYFYVTEYYTQSLILLYTNENHWIGQHNLKITEEERILNFLTYSTIPNSWLK